MVSIYPYIYVLVYVYNIIDSKYTCIHIMYTYIFTLKI